jgi:hypothetical protein
MKPSLSQYSRAVRNGTAAGEPFGKWFGEWFGESFEVDKVAGDAGIDLLILHDRIPGSAGQRRRILRTVDLARIERRRGLGAPARRPHDRARRLFIATRIDVGPLAWELGCALVDGPFGALIQTDDMKATSVPGVFACGDAARAMASLPLAIGDGAPAGAAVHRSLVVDGLH